MGLRPPFLFLFLSSQNSNPLGGWGLCVGVWVSVCEELCFTNQYKSEANQSLVTILSLNSRASRVLCNSWIALREDL